MEKVLSILLAIVYCTIATTTETFDECKKVPVIDSRNYFLVQDEKRGNCTNSQTIHNLHECVGLCTSSPIYNSTRNQLVPGCMLCAPDMSVYEDIHLDCEDGSELSTSFINPIKCSCKECLYVTPVPGEGIVVPPPNK